MQCSFWCYFQFQSVSHSVSLSVSQAVSHTLLLPYFKNSILLAKPVPSPLRTPICGLCQNGRLTPDIMPVLITTMRTNQSRTSASPGSRWPRNKSGMHRRIGSLRVYRHWQNGANCSAVSQLAGLARSRSCRNGNWQNGTPPSRHIVPVLLIPHRRPLVHERSEAGYDNN